MSVVQNSGGNAVGGRRIKSLIDDAADSTSKGVAGAINAHARVAAHGAMAQIDHHYGTLLADHHAALDATAAETKHVYNLGLAANQGLQTRLGAAQEHGYATERDSARFSHDDHMQAATHAHENRKMHFEQTHQALSQSADRTHERYMLASRNVHEARMQGLASDSTQALRRLEQEHETSKMYTAHSIRVAEGDRQSDKHAHLLDVEKQRGSNHVELEKERGSQGRRTYGYKARIDASVSQAAPAPTPAAVPAKKKPAAKRTPPIVKPPATP